MSNNHEVSVIIPTYNRSDLLKLTIKSVKEQTFKDLEIIIVDDGSTDDTREVIKQLQTTDRRIIYIYQDNRGLPSARNTGIKNSHGKYIAFVDSDDLWESEKIEKQLLIFNQSNDIDVVYVNFYNIDINGAILTPNIQNTDPDFQSFSLYEKLLYFNAVVGSASSVMAKRESILRTGDFDENFCSAEDRDYWTRMALHSNFYFLDEYLVLLRRHKGCQTNDLLHVWEGAHQYLKKLHRDTPPQYQFHLPEVSYKMYKEYMKKFFNLRSIQGFTMGIYLLIKITNLGFRYVIKLSKDFSSSISKKIPRT